jgi:hypothetical protein
MTDPKKWPPSPEELEAKVAELRADPAKAAAFRADLHKRMQQAFDKLPKWPVPLDQLISEAFSFLVGEYGFTEHERTTGGRFGSITVKEYSNAKVVVRVGAGGIDTDGFCLIDFENKTTGTRYQFWHLLSERNPQFEHPSNAASMDVARAHLQMYAAALRAHAEDVLLGDFSVFHR